MARSYRIRKTSCLRDEVNDMKKKIILIAAAALALSFVFSLTACGGEKKASSYADGTYKGRSADHNDDADGNGAGYGEVEIEIKDSQVVSCTFKTYELDGTLKDENYGADLSKENRLRAQKAVQSAEKYASKLVEAGKLDGVDSISGATITYNEFIEAVNNALSSASKN